MADEDLNTEGSEKEKADEKAAEKAFQDSFKETGNRESDFRMVGGDDADDDSDDDSADDDDSSDADDDTGDDDQDDAGAEQDDQAGDDNGDQDDKDKGKGDKEPTIKDVLALVAGLEGKIQNNLTREIGGRLGRIEQRLKPADMTAAKTAAADAAKDKGKKVPSKERVEKALKSVAGFADMEKDFPDYAVVLRESLTALVTDMDAETGAHVQPIDEAAVVQKAVATIRQQDEQSAAAQKEVEAEFAKIESAWPGWQPMLKGKDWKEWSAKKLAGPDGKEYDRVFKSGSTRETISVFQEFSNETGVKPKSKDGTQSAGNGHQQASTKNSDRRRRSASRPRGSASAPAERPDSEEDAFQRSFKERRGG